MRDVYKRTLQLSSKVIVQHLQLDQTYPELQKIPGIEHLLEKVKNKNRYESRAEAIDVLLDGLKLFDDNAYITFVNAAGMMSDEILDEILNNKKIALEELKKEEIRRQRLIDAHQEQQPSPCQLSSEKSQT